MKILEFHTHTGIHEIQMYFGLVHTYNQKLKCNCRGLESLVHPRVKNATNFAGPYLILGVTGYKYIY